MTNRAAPDSVAAESLFRLDGRMAVVTGAASGRGNLAYTVAKHGVNGLTCELAVEWARDIVGPVAFLVSDAASMVTGTMLPVDGGNLAFNAGGSKTW